MLRLACALALAGAAAATFQANSLLVLRVGDGVASLAATGAVPAAKAAPVFLDNYDPAFAAAPLNAGSPAVAGIVIAGNDYSMGTLTLGEPGDGQRGSSERGRPFSLKGQKEAAGRERRRRGAGGLPAH